MDHKILFGEKPLSFELAQTPELCYFCQPDKEGDGLSPPITSGFDKSSYRAVLDFLVTL
jgi:hypothetical protein